MHQKILIITDNLKDQVNGVAITFSSIEKEALKDNCKFYYIDPSNFKHFSAPLYPEVKLSLAFSISDKIDSIKPDCIHIATEGPIGLAARIYCERRKYRYNTSYHTRFPEFMEEIYHIPKSLTYAYLRWFHKNSHVVLTNTDSMITLLQRNKFKARLEKWSRGVDLARLKSSIENKQDGTVLYVGRVSKEKNLEALLKLEDKFSIVIVGDGPHREFLEAKYKKVNFVGYKDGEELANYYKKASVFAFPSWSDTFGIVIIEAMSQGCPVASFPSIGPKDIIENYVTGIVSTDLEYAISEAMHLDRKVVLEKSSEWTWKRSWQQFKKHLVAFNSNL